MTAILSPVAPYLNSLDGLLNTTHSGDEFLYGAGA